MNISSIINKNFNLVKSNLDRIQAKYIGSYLVAQFSLLLCSPFLSRVYTPSDFANGSLFFTTSSILGTISTLSLENSILIESDEKNITNATFLSIVIAFLFTSLVQILPFKNLLFETFDQFELDIKFFIYYLPLSIFLLGTFNSLRLLIIRNSIYKFLGITKIILGAFIPLLSLFFGVNGLGYKGLIYSYIIGLIIVNILLTIVLLKKSIFKISYFSLKRLLKIFTRNRSLTLWTTPSNLISNLNSSLPVFFIGYFYGEELLGQYELAYRAIYFPIGIFISAFRDIFRDKITNEIKKFGNCRNSFSSFFKILTRISIFILGPILIFFPYLFSYVFGKQWSYGGFLIQSMFLLICVNFVSSPLSYVLIICKKQKLDFLWQISFLFTTFISFLIPYFFKLNISLKNVLFNYSFLSFVMYLIAIYLAYSASKKLS